MSGPKNNQVIVGIDGSEQAEHAALWAADEAAARNATLRLVYVIRTDLSGTPTAAGYQIAVATAKRALMSVRTRIAERDGGLTISTTIAQGSPGGVLISRNPRRRHGLCRMAGMVRLG